MFGSFVGAEPFYNDAVAATAVAVKNDAGQLFALKLINTTAAAAYLQIFDVVQASVNVGTTVPRMVVPLAANESFVMLLPVPLKIGTPGKGNVGISIAGTTTPGGNGAAAIKTMLVFE
jgi:hypothetical protein